MGSFGRVLLKLGALLLAALPLSQAVAAQAGPPAPTDAAKQATHTSYGISLYGTLKYGPDFKNFAYVNPNAPQGGTVHFSSTGSYDSFNPFALRGTSAISLLNMYLVYDPLMSQSFDERGTYYCLLCETVTYPDDYSWAEYKLRKNARWHDGTPITADDVVFTFNAMQEHSAPIYRSVFQEATKIVKTGPLSVRVYFKTVGNRRNLLIMAPMAIAPEHYWKGKDFEAPVVKPPLSSGPYDISAYDLGRSYTLTRVKNYWGNNLAVNRGRYNYDKMITDYYRDTVIAFEAFKAGDFDVRVESSPQSWTTGYVWPAAKHGDVLKLSIPSSDTFLYEGFFFNTRRPLFSDPVLREALAYAFDFKWMNKNLFYDFFTRTRSYFGTDELAAKGLPSPAEFKLLEPYRNQLPPRVFTQEYNPPDTDGTPEGLRGNLRIASQMLQKAGYTVKNGKMISPITHQPVAFQILISDPAAQLVSSHWADNLKLLGIDITLNQMDLPQYIKTTQEFNYDVIVSFTATLATPGQEQRSFWSSKAADTKGSANYAGVKSPVVDMLLDKMIDAQTMDDLTTATHALDRVLSWGFYSVPHYSGGGSIKIGVWNRFGQPKITQTFGLGYTDAWWIDPQKDASVHAIRGTAN